MKISFLLTWAYGMGGLVRTTVNTANHFAEQGHDVTLISFWRHKDEPFFDLHPGIELRSLIDLRDQAAPGRVERWARNRPSVVLPEGEPFTKNVTLYGDHLLRRTLRSLDADVLITTRPAYNLAAAMWAPEHTLTIGQDHLNYTQHQPSLRWHMKQWYPRLDALVALTEADRKDYQRLLKNAPTTVRAIGNAVSAGPHPRSDQTQHVVVAAGRLTTQKRYDHLIRAFATVVEERPDWSLRIFGIGPEDHKLQALIERLGVEDHVTLMGITSDTEAEFAKGSIMAMSSRVEGFPMVILEAFACGVPVVSYNCPRGPGEMITNGHDGLVVKNDSPAALARGLRTLIDDDTLRTEMGANAVTTAAQHGIDLVAGRWEELFTELRANRAERPDRPVKKTVKRRLRELAAHRQARVRWT